jgi:hypothetical protein
VLISKFGPQRQEVSGRWRKLHNEELRNLYASTNIISIIKSRRMRWVGDVACIEEIRNAYKSLVGRHEGKRPLGRSRHRWEHNIGTDLRELGWEDVDWMQLAQAGSCKHVNKPSVSIKGGKFLEYLSDY